MAELYVYNGTHLTLIRARPDHDIELTESADHGEVGTGKVSIDDATGTYEVVGHKAFYAQQDACSVPRTFTGYIGSRNYQRNTERTGAARFIDVNLLDLNARLGFYVIRGRTWNRPRETIGERMTALLASTFLAPLVVDDGFVDYPTDELDKNDYRGQFPLDVIRDCALVVGYNYFVYWSSSANDAALWFRDSNASTAFSSTLRISNVSTDIDSSTTFAASQDTVLERDPAQTYSGVQVPFAKGSVFRARAATSLAYEPRHAVAPNSQVKKRAKAITLADHFLFERRNEEDVIRTTMLAVPNTKVNLVRAGQRIEGKFSHYATEGYGEFSWFRILEATKKPINAEGALYDIPLVLSPQEGGCSVTPTFVQHRYVDSVGTTPYTETFSYSAATAPGNLLVVGILNSETTGPGDILSISSGAAAWNWPIVNQDTHSPGPNNACNVFWKKSEGETSFTITWAGATITSSVRVVMVEYAGLTNPTLFDSDQNRQDPGIGSSTMPTVSYPAGPTAVVSVCFMADGPQGGDNLDVDAPATLRTAIAGGLHGSQEAAISDRLLNTTASTTSWRTLFTSTAPTLNVGLVFQGDNC